MNSFVSRLVPLLADLKPRLLARMRRHRVGLSIMAGLFVLFGLLGYFWLPGFVKGKAEMLLSERLHRPVSVERIDISPYTLEVTLHGFRIGEREGAGTLLSLESLYINLSTASIARVAPVVSAITVKAPHLHLARAANGELSVADLIEEFLAQPPAEEPARFSVSNIQVEGGAIVFDDHFKQSRQQISDISLGIPFVASFASKEEVWVQPRFSARINDDSEINLSGRLRPFADKREAVLAVKLDGLDLTGIDEYAPPLKGIKLISGLLDTDLEITFTQAGEVADELRLSGAVTLRNLEVDNHAGLPWHVRGERIVVQVASADLMLKTPIAASLEASKLSLQQRDKPPMKIDSLVLSDIRADVAARRTDFKLESVFANKGSARAEGWAGWAPLAAELKLTAERVDLVPLQEILVPRPGLAITRADANFNGTIKAGGSPLNIALAGDASIADFNMLDKGNQHDLLRWRNLDVHGISVNTLPLDIAVKSMALSDFFARIIIMPDGSLRLRDVMAEGGELHTVHAIEVAAEKQAAALADKQTQKTATGTLTSAPVVESKPALPLRIDEITFKNGSVDFNDRFIKPNYRANLTRLSGQVGPLHAGQPGAMALTGRVNRVAPLEIKGKLDPFGKELYLDITAKASGIDLPGFSPYSSRYIGYEIAKGKLSVDLHYFIEKKQLQAENNIFLDQLTLGDKVESPDALSLPVGLAISLLKNSRGEIDINLPVSGSLDDPEFSIGGLVVKVFFNLIAKAVTAPFALLGSMFGGGTDLSQIDFAPGTARLTPEAEKSLDALSKAMADRPAIKLEVTGVADLVGDKDGLKRAQLDRRVKAQKLADMAKQGQAGGSVSDVEVSAAEYPKYLEQVYKNEKFDKPRNLIGLTKSLPVPEMEQLLLAYLPAGEDEMRGLAERRARNAREALLTKGVPSERVFVLQPKLETSTDSKKLGGRVEFSMR